MSRPKKDTPAGKLAVEKWRETMIKKYGSEEAFKEQVRKQGSKGGKASGFPKGFALDPERAKWAGAKGGAISRRTGKYTETIKTNIQYIRKNRERGVTLTRIASDLGVPYNSLVAYLIKNK